MLLNKYMTANWMLTMPGTDKKGCGKHMLYNPVAMFYSAGIGMVQIFQNFLQIKRS